MREMRVRDKVFFYHSSCALPAIVGIASVVREAYPDHTQFDPKNVHYDAKASRKKPRWEMVDIRAVKAFKRPIPLDVLRKTSALKKMVLLRKGSRLSVQPVRPEEWKIITKLSG
jgi:predicted RNA-binding protein with PUA-like domain